MRTFKLTWILMLAVMATTYATELVKGDFDGVWEYQAEQAPEGYKKGTISIDGSTLELKINDYQNYSGKEVMLKGKTLSFYIYVEGDRVDIKLTLKDGEVTGVANTQDGVIPLKLSKKQ